MHIDKALKIIDEAKLIVERKKVSEMTPEEYEKDLEARRKRRELRKQRDLRTFLRLSSQRSLPMKISDARTPSRSLRATKTLRKRSTLS